VPGLRGATYRSDSGRFSRWAQRGVWKAIFQALAAEADNEYAMIDSTIVRAHQHSAGAVKKRSTSDWA
jgi:transposase